MAESKQDLWAIVIQPEPTREYGEVELIGAFTSQDLAEDHLVNNIELGDGWMADVTRIASPEE